MATPPPSCAVQNINNIKNLSDYIASLVPAGLVYNSHLSIFHAEKEEDVRPHQKCNIVCVGINYVIATIIASLYIYMTSLVNQTPIPRLWMGDAIHPAL